MKKWILAEGAILVAILVVCWQIKIQLTQVAQAKVIQPFEIYVETDQGLVPYSRVRLVKVAKLEMKQAKKQTKVIFPFRQDVQRRISEIEPELADTLILLAKCESTLNSDAVGDYGNSYGLYQVFLKWHPEVSQAQAQDIEFATRWTASKIRQGQGHLWSCWTKI